MRCRTLLILVLVGILLLVSIISVRAQSCEENCDEWKNKGCQDLDYFCWGEAMHQRRACSIIGCEQDRCIGDVSCCKGWFEIPGGEVWTCENCSCGDWVRKGCGKGGCKDDEMYWTRSCDPKGCKEDTRCEKDDNCPPGCTDSDLGNVKWRQGTAEDSSGGYTDYCFKLLRGEIELKEYLCKDDTVNSKNIYAEGDCYFDYCISAEFCLDGVIFPYASRWNLKTCHDSDPGSNFYSNHLTTPGTTVVDDPEYGRKELNDKCINETHLVELICVGCNPTVSDCGEPYGSYGPYLYAEGFHPFGGRTDSLGIDCSQETEVQCGYERDAFGRIIKPKKCKVSFGGCFEQDGIGVCGHPPESDYSNPDTLSPSPSGSGIYVYSMGLSGTRCGAQGIFDSCCAIEKAMNWQLPPYNECWLKIEGDTLECPDDRCIFCKWYPSVQILEKNENTRTVTLKGYATTDYSDRIDVMVIKIWSAPRYFDSKKTLIATKKVPAKFLYTGWGNHYTTDEITITLPPSENQIMTYFMGLEYHTLLFGWQGYLSDEVPEDKPMPWFMGKDQPFYCFESFYISNGPIHGCGDGEDNDGDGLIDKDDPDCQYGDGAEAAGAPTVAEDCTDRVDNDGDGLVDCKDSDCNYKVCAPEKVCINSVCTISGDKCCYNPSADPQRVCSDTNLDECCPKPESAHPEYYSSKEGPKNFDECKKDFFKPVNCAEVDKCDSSCCCPIEEMGPSIRCSATGGVFVPNVNSCTIGTTHLCDLLNTSQDLVVTILSPQDGLVTDKQNIVIVVATNVDAVCSYGATKNASEQTETFGNIGKAHISSEIILEPGKYTYYVKCKLINVTGGTVTKIASTSFRILSQPEVEMDATPPITPVVDDSSDISGVDPEYTFYTDRLRVSWFSEDNESGIGGYKYWLLEFETNNLIHTDFVTEETFLVRGGAVIRNIFFIKNLSLNNNTRYYFKVSAVNNLGLWSSNGSSDGITVDTSLEPSKDLCENEKLDSGETDVDCGGICNPCDLDMYCISDDDCKSGLVCQYGICIKEEKEVGTCSNGKLDVGETDVDCGGKCGPCNLGKTCVSDGDCRSGLECDDGVCVEEEKSVCINGRVDVGETDVDCGGICIAKGKLCDLGKICKFNSDCKSESCVNGKCVEKSGKCVIGEIVDCVVDSCEGTKTCINGVWSMCIKDDPLCGVKKSGLVSTQWLKLVIWLLIIIVLSIASYFGVRYYQEKRKPPAPPPEKPVFRPDFRRFEEERRMRLEEERRRRLGEERKKRVEALRHELKERPKKKVKEEDVFKRLEKETEELSKAIK